MTMVFVIGALVIVLLGAALASVRVLREYERAVVFRLGRLLPVRGPGLVALIPLVDRMVRVDLRTVTLTVPPQEVITRDNVPARVAAVCYFRVVDPSAAVTAIEAFAPATSQIAQTTLRSVLGGADLDQLLAERDRLNEHLQKIIDEQTEPWGIKVSTVEIKDVEIPEVMQRAMARQAEAERERRAKIINAEGEYQAAEKLASAAAIVNRRPYSCATCRRCSRSAPTRARRSSSRSRWTCSRPSSAPPRTWRPRAVPASTTAATPARRAEPRRSVRATRGDGTLAADIRSAARVQSGVAVAR
jgi:hypothetical protein